MTWRLIRGGIIGIFIGAVGGMLISVGMNMDTLLGYDKNKSTQVMAVQNDTDALENVEETGENELNDFSENEALRDIIFRFHVRGNSNSDEDINVKYQVRDSILDEIKLGVEACETKEEMYKYIETNLDNIKSVAEKKIEELGYDYPVKVYIADDYFPARQYGEMIMPAGNYQALRVDIGEASGENFWCMLYPVMCHTIDSGAVVTKEDEEVIRKELGDEEFDKLFVKRDTEDNQVKVRFKFLEWFGL